jgi:cyclic beta-1,2-glucan synthetase
VMAVALGIGIGFERLAALWSAGPILLLWACSKPVSQWLNQPQHTAPYEMSAKDLLFLRGIAVRTWRYFAEYGGEEHHWLIPDNLQHDPERVAARTSPTDIGLLLNVRLAACEMGYLTVPELAELTRRTLACLEELPKFRGHLFNWYSTQTLEPLAPRFVSSADSGNLAAALWALSEGCREYLRKPLLPARLLEGFIDHLRLAGVMPGRTWPLLPMCPAGPADWLPYMSEAVASVCNVDRDEIDHYVVQNEKDDCRWFAAEARRRYESVASTVRAYCPWMLPEFLSLRDALEIGHELNDKEVSPEQLPEFIGRLSKRLAWMQAENPNSAYDQLQSLLEDAYRNAIQLIGAMRRISMRARQLADEMDFNFLFNPRRKLLSVGFDAESRQLMPACYDLLASEARLAVFVAVAKEDIPQESWFLLGRSHVLNDGRPVLLSWTGTMFEYLMPSLWMNTYPDTLLARACTEAVRAQQSYAAGKHTPWGISESAHAKRHDTGSYQYSAFGVPPLALHPVDADLPVVSPYSTVLALPVDTAGALRNLRRMVKEGWFQAYGFCDAADYNVEHRSLHHGDCELVRCWMAHHQGMSMLALVNLLHGNVVQRWFHNNPQVQATERLLQEKPVGWVQRDVLRSRTAA